MFSRKSIFWMLFFMPLFGHAMSTTSLTVMSAKESGQLLVKNNGRTDMQYHMSAQEISFPNGKQHRIDSGENTLSLSERYFILRPGMSKDIQLTYRGDMLKEHYYQLSVQEKTLCDGADCNHKSSSSITSDEKGSQISLDATIRPLVIITPSQPDYRYQASNDVLSNTGNSSILLMLDNVCTKKALRTWLIAPGMKIDMPVVQPTERLSIGEKSRIVNIIENVCQGELGE